MYQYKVVAISFNTSKPELFEEALNRFAQDGWRVVSVFPTVNGYVDNMKVVLEKSATVSTVSSKFEDLPYFPKVPGSP